jgi:hypothetical protein
MAARLGDAPVASWVLARLAALVYLPEEPAVVTQEGGGYALELLASADEEVVAWLQLQGADGVALFGETSFATTHVEVVECFLSGLLSAPDAVAYYALRVRDPDWKYEPEEFVPIPAADDFNSYGWDGVSYLGSRTIRERLGESDVSRGDAADEARLLLGLRGLRS